MRSKTFLYFMALFGLVFLFACGPKAVAPEAQMDTPEHHVTNGNKFLKADKLDEAFTAFTRATQLDPKYAPAYVGLGLVHGKQGIFDKAFDAMKQAARFAKTDAQHAETSVGYIRLYTMGGPAVEENWLNKAGNHFERAHKLAPRDPAPYFYMGMAYRNAYRFSDAAGMFKAVLDLDKDFVEAADREYAVMQRIERAMPGTSVGKKIALLEAITRADVAALFIEELKVDELFEKNTPKTFDTAFKAPGAAFKTGEYVKAPAVTDIDNHVLRQDIEAVVRLQIKGLQPGPDHTFEPDKYITRAEFAMMIEDILIKITGDNSLATRFIGTESPFPDLRSDLAFFNAAMVCVTRNIMETVDTATGEFRPQGMVSGADALLSIRQMKVQLNK
ncbi:tetratricopeptide repeat protein [Desulfosudis oleivorans]|uniref:TPR repeat-containing protein n=1 Tax=Desulfosudis oleivorans (strain DSM 6200 / JCM 39069 / Hxd3) TaxID=96561 RepID=A8ZRT0_DESOH|nr:tetratricopeptide repeat protein [Desulfosudis oleivorans]ABW65847.1 TPR repeat-containing protein [Desulfosudis oleivorans Hxd3]